MKVGIQGGKRARGRAYFRFQQFAFGGVGHRPLGPVEDGELVALEHFASVIGLPFCEDGADGEEGAKYEIGDEKHGVF